MRCVTWVGVACALLLLCDPAGAANYGSSLGEPNTVFDHGVVRYDSATGWLTIDATPRATRTTPGEPRIVVEPPSSLTIKAKVHPVSGRVVRGTFQMEGEIDDYEDGVEYSGVLLAGELEELRWVNRAGSDLFVLRFGVTGGSLAPLYADAPIQSVVTVRSSTFTGSFATSFDGTATGYVGIPSEDDFVCALSSSITSEFNGTPIPAGSTVWFNSVLKLKGATSGPVTISFKKVTIQSANGLISTPVPDGTVTFSPSATMATTTFAGGWVTTVPLGLGGNAFFTGVGFPVPGGLPGGIKKITWSGDIHSDMPGVAVQWKWGAAVYTTFDNDPNALGVKPVDDPDASAYPNSDHAGTPENFKAFVTGGARGGGGSNFTGSYSGTVTTPRCQ